MTQINRKFKKKSNSFYIVLKNYFSQSIDEILYNLKKNENIFLN